MKLLRAKRGQDLICPVEATDASTKYCGGTSKVSHAERRHSVNTEDHLHNSYTLLFPSLTSLINLLALACRSNFTTNMRHLRKTGQHTLFIVLKYTCIAKEHCTQTLPASMSRSASTPEQSFAYGRLHSGELHWLGFTGRLHETA